MNGGLQIIRNPLLPDFDITRSWFPTGTLDAYMHALNVNAHRSTIDLLFSALVRGSIRGVHVVGNWGGGGTVANRQIRLRSVGGSGNPLFWFGQISSGTFR